MTVAIEYNNINHNGRFHWFTYSKISRFFKLIKKKHCPVDQIMNLNHSRIPLNTPKKFHQNRSSRLEGVQLQTHSQKNYIYKD